VAHVFLGAGYRVAVTYRGTKEWSALSEREANAVRESRLLGFAVDVTDAAAVESAAGEAARAFGELGVLVHAAGGFAGGEPVDAVKPETVRAMIDLNLVSAFWAARAVAPHAVRTGRGRLLFVSSRGAMEQNAGAAAYGAATLGLHGLVETLAKELKHKGVTANAVLPSLIDTAANRRDIPGGKFDDWVKPEAIAELLLYLASEAAASTSGALVPIYGRA
jgi:NAD(P)-dependent dehydrogenase (short-subunit alcohol dehydrogenase family)